MPNEKELYADVLLPLALPKLYTYRVPSELAGEAVPGKRVIVPFGPQKVYSALIRKIHETHADPSTLKSIQSVLDDLPVVNELQFKLWDWIADYYMCSAGEVMNSALPAALKLQSETNVQLVDGFDPSLLELSSAEINLVELLAEKKNLTIDEIAGFLHRVNVHPLIKRCYEKGMIILSEEILERFKPKKESFIRLAEAYKSDASLEQLFKEMDSDPRKVKQLEALMTFMKYLFDVPERDAVKKTILTRQKSFPKSSLTTLITNGILVEFEVIVDRIPVHKGTLQPISELSDVQSEGLQQIKTSFAKHNVTLLHGVTSSGKTELYIHLIEEAINKGKQVLYLLPEIALTTQIINRLQKFFGERIGVYHSRYSGSERVEIWNHVLGFNTSPAHYNCRSQIILGARSALFLPFKELGLIIVDEEHDGGYKQADPAPRYNARDSAIVLANIHKAKTVLGSATPSLETYFNAKNDRYGLVNLTERHHGMEMPEIVIADMKEARKRKLMKSIFTPQLLKAIEKALENKEQIILFQNRRGFSPFIECKNCNWIPHCKNCSVTLTYHKHNNTLRCHYCGYVELLPSFCPECRDHQLEVKGFGTEKIEEEVAVFFPDAVIARMDLDSTRSKSSYQRLIADFEDRKIDILVGTQMVTKGLDFDNVSTVGILNADQLLNYPDFRSHERGFQLMSQVSGRSGRKSKRGKVVIQTYQADHPVLADVIKHNYEGFYNLEMIERKKFVYPPLCRLIELTLRHKDEKKVHDAASDLTDMLREKLGMRILGPNIPLVPRIKNHYHRTILIKVEKSISITEVKNTIRGVFSKFFSIRENQSIRVIPDVDPN